MSPPKDLIMNCNSIACSPLLRHTLAAIVLRLVIATLCSATIWASERPNVVFILADDLGYGDVQCFGEDRCQIATPHFDRLAREGMRFTSAYSICSVCVPSRMAIMTGRYPWRFERPERGGPWGFLGLQFPTEQHTIADMLKSAGYRTGYVGKWHLGTRMTTTDGQVQGPTNVDYTQPLQVGPRDYGFDESFILPGSLDMFPYAFNANGRWVGSVTAQKGWSAFNRIGPAAEDFEDTAVLDTFCRQAESFIDRSAKKKSQPFFLYLALTSPHTPLSPRPEFDGKSRLGVYGDFVMETDDCVGRVLAALDRHGLARNTLVIVTSDHGAASYAGRRRKATEGQLLELQQDGHYACGIFRGYKFSVYEGGFRVPYVVRWPEKIAAGSHCGRVIALPDLAATLADITETPLASQQAPDSHSFAGLFADPQADSKRETVILQATRAMAIRHGDWKLVFAPGAGCDDRWLIPTGHVKSWQEAIARHGPVRERGELLHADFVQLFDLQADPAETRDLSAERPDVVERLYARFRQQVEAGRSTPGPKLPAQNVQAFRSVPEFVGKGDR